MKFNPDDTRKFLAYVMPPGTCIEMRVFRAQYGRNGFVEPSQYASTLAGWYDNPDSLIVDASKLRGISGFLTFNPVNPALLARSDNKLVKSKHTTLDDNILEIRWLYVDIDPIRPADISSTDEELALAVKRRDLILLEFPEIRDAAIWGKSGNGCWILARVEDMPNRPKSREAIGDALAELSARYSDDRIEIDTSTKNPSRIMGIPGTYKCKGSSRPERPWRLATFDGVGQP